MEKVVTYSSSKISPNSATSAIDELSRNAPAGNFTSMRNVFETGRLNMGLAVIHAERNTFYDNII
jgi:hypothetical protein